MAKKTTSRKGGKVEQIHIPKCCQQPRSRAPKPRTDFSPFVCSSSTSSASSSPSSSPPEAAATTAAGDRLAFYTYRRRRGPALELLSCKDGLSSITTASVEQGCKENEAPKFPLVQSSPKNKGQEGLLSDSVGLQLTEADSVYQNAMLDICDARNIRRHVSDTDGTLAFTPDKSTSRISESNDVWIIPGNIVWAKTACQMWWPAEIMGESSTPISTSNQCVDGQVLVQYFGKHECAWVDPVGDLSQFENCFESKSCNPMKSFQDALKQALHRKEQIDSFRLSDQSPDVQNIQTPEKWNASSSSRTDGDHLERGRGKRKRKPKVHFDEVTFPMKPVKKVRRFRIMRYLGLVAPIGSPFSLTPHLRTT
ncbi:PREDICTED: uncharacterized protein LOC104604578 [Nelumbo nucifera]|uniref:Uncharacterized protein LOC104604578 n=2 Tax=Nelumbo nucifera TaxID=4432 RepID=A0A1U8AHZ0_NELNU|nr:PREDICTED: uncharacterized protein LOC104604578 [Nelumbo nucifera]DAD48783.1 TPA_asm: hypothetical protein HUJ06_018720 [Nelumbo nucifera]